MNPPAMNDGLAAAGIARARARGRARVRELIRRDRADLARFGRIIRRAGQIADAIAPPQPNPPPCIPKNKSRN